MKNTIKFLVLIICMGTSLIFAQNESSNLKKWPEGKSPEEIGKRVALKFVDSGHSPTGTAKTGKQATKITYREVCTWLGALWFADVTNDKMLFQSLEDRFSPLFMEEKHLQPVPNHVDNNVFGALPLELYLQTKNEKYLKLGLNYADSQWELPDEATPEQKAWTDKGYSWQTRVWIDDMFMITALQTQSYRATHNPKYIERAAREMVLYLDSIQLENGLFHHSPEAHFSWARGNGWMAVGMPELLRIMPKENPNRAKIMDAYKKMMQALLQYQESDGMWRQIIDDPEAWKETSGTAMFTYAMITGVKNGWLNKETYGASARKGWLALVSYLDQKDELTEVCEGTGTKNSRDHYLNRRRITGDLHGQAPLLWCAVALLRQ